MAVSASCRHSSGAPEPEAARVAQDEGFHDTRVGASKASTVDTNARCGLLTERDEVRLLARNADQLKEFAGVEGLRLVALASVYSTGADERTNGLLVGFHDEIRVGLLQDLLCCMLPWPAMLASCRSVASACEETRMSSSTMRGGLPLLVTNRSWGFRKLLLSELSQRMSLAPCRS